MPNVYVADFVGSIKFIRGRVIAMNMKITDIGLQVQIIQCIEERDLRGLRSILRELEETEVLYLISNLERTDKALVYRLLSKDMALAVFEQLDLEIQKDLLESFPESRAIEIIEELDPDDRVSLLDELPAVVTKRLISLLSPDDRAVTNKLLGYEAETAGRIMTPEFITLRRNMTAQAALEKIRWQAADKETIYTLYVTDETRRLEGVLELRKLIVANPNERIEDIMSDIVIKVTTDTDQEEVAHALKDFDLLAIPVVDKQGCIVGIVTIDDAVDILEHEATEDIYDQAGLANITGSETNRSEVLVNGSLWAIWKVRLPFLVITLLAGLGAGLIIDGFEHTLETIVAVAIFIPIIMDMGGNVGTQSTTVFVRGVVLGHIEPKRFWRHLGKEVLIGFSLGLIVGVVTGVIAGFWQSMPLLGLAVGLALLVTMTLASLLGFLVPWILIKMKLDQAAGSSPIITSIKDIVGLLVYFVLVSAFLVGF